MRLLELYTTVQGEGPNVGKPTTFVRFAGCNMRCPGWPCDTPYSIYPEIWRKESEEKDPKEIFLMVKGLRPKHVCITGGEPLLQPRAEMKELLWFLWENGYTVDIFTNGSRPLYKPPDVNYLMDHITFVMDWKLPGSGEFQSYMGHRLKNLYNLRNTDAVKMVCKDEVDLLMAQDNITTWFKQQMKFQVYIGAAWGQLKEIELVNWLTEHDFPHVKLNVQVHKFIFDPNARRI